VITWDGLEDLRSGLPGRDAACASCARRWRPPLRCSGSPC